MNLMLRSWCTLDFALAQVMTTGGHYQRPHTLAAGDKLCDMKWFASGMIGPDLILTLIDRLQGRPGAGDLRRAGPAASRSQRERWWVVTEISPPCQGRCRGRPARRPGSAGCGGDARGRQPYRGPGRDGDQAVAAAPWRSPAPSSSAISIGPGSVWWTATASRLVRPGASRH
jgi:hypothetical protein